MKLLHNSANVHKPILMLDSSQLNPQFSVLNTKTVSFLTTVPQDSVFATQKFLSFHAFPNGVRNLHRRCVTTCCLLVLRLTNGVSLETIIYTGGFFLVRKVFSFYGSRSAEKMFTVSRISVSLVQGIS